MYKKEIKGEDGLQTNAGVYIIIMATQKNLTPPPENLWNSCLFLRTFFAVIWAYICILNKETK